MIDPKTLALEIASAHADRRIIEAPSTRDAAFDLATAYATEAQLARLRREGGHATVGRKIGFANKAMWRVLKLDTLVWGHMYDDTVRYADGNAATLSIGRMVAPKIEPEIVFKMSRPLADGDVEAGAVLGAVEWIALGFEIIDCAYPDWKFQPVDFVASYGLHAGLIVGAPLRVQAGMIPELVEHLPSFTVKLQKHGAVVAEGSGKNSLRSPALAVGELAAALSRQAGTAPLSAGELVSSGTLTESQFIAAGETWTAAVDGLSLPDLTVRTVA
ncbi:MAG: fumarylacetoacetate hydrolase family protein [Vicinamibacterales bacterium]